MFFKFSIFSLIFWLKPNLSIDKEFPEGTEHSFAVLNNSEPNLIPSSINKPEADRISDEPKLLEQTNSAGKSVLCAPVCTFGRISYRSIS